jgi:hypothetical protein
MLTYPAFSQILYPPHTLVYLDTAIPLASMDAFGDISENYIHENIDMLETEPFSDQMDNQGLNSQLQ